MEKFKLFMINYLEEAAAKGAAIKAEEREKKRIEKLREDKRLRRERAIFAHKRYEEGLKATTEQRRQAGNRQMARLDAKIATMRNYYKLRAECPRDPVTKKGNVLRHPEANSWYGTGQSRIGEENGKRYRADQLRRAGRDRAKAMRLYRKKIRKMVKVYIIKEQIMRGQNGQLEFFGYVKVFVCLCIFCFCLYWVYSLIMHLYYIWYYDSEIKKNKHRRFYYDFYVFEKPSIHDIYNKYKNPRLVDLEISYFRKKTYFFTKFITNNFCYYLYKIAAIKKCVIFITKYGKKTDMFFNEEIPCQGYYQKNKLISYYTKLEKTNKNFFFVKKIVYLIVMFLIAFLVTVFFLRIKNVIFFPFKIAMHCVDIIAVLETSNFYTFDYNSEFGNRCIFAVVIMMICVVFGTWLAFSNLEEKKRVYKQKYEQEKKLTADFDKKHSKEIEVVQKKDAC